MVEQSCPSAKELLAYSNNTLSENVRNIELHIANCKLCSEALDEFSKATSSLDLKIAENIKKSNSSKLVNTILIISSIFTIIGITYWARNATKKSIFIKEDSIVQKNNNEQKNKIVRASNSDRTTTAIKTNEGSHLTNKSTTTANKISSRNARENKVSDSSLSKNYTPPKREFFKRAFPIKYINKLKTIDYQHLYEKIDEKNISVLKSIDPRNENLKFTLEATEISNDQKLSYNEILATALLAFSNGDFETCERYFTLILRTYPNDENALFYSGLSFYKQNRTRQAIPLLEQLSQRNSSPFHEDALWNLALCYKEENRIAEVKLTLEKLININQLYSERAKLLMSQL
jgi:TolA-binding protein